MSLCIWTSFNFKRLDHEVRGPGGKLNERQIVATTDQTVSGVPGRYASALFELATDEKTTEKVGEQLQAFAAAIAASDDLTRLVRSPVFTSEDQIAAIDGIAAKLGINGTALNFLRLTARNRRLSALPGMIDLSLGSGSATK